ncbi:transcriptional repressor [Candidatus Bathyarchaeota archaeon A05DMB-2]|jgi:Fur family peroxide stress response transcriptional regulator|nr:transcriptional repressor [Candidatus Bathyarchaeota archaeon A05DMB-2]
MNEQQLITRLRSKGYKVTPQRIAICQLILSSKDHPSAEQIYQEVKKTYPAISLATVYITLDLLKKLGLVQELGFSDQSSRYDPNNSPHINVICPRCGKIYDYEAPNVKKLWYRIIAETGLKPLRQRLDLYTLCNKCSQENPTP